MTAPEITDQDILVGLLTRAGIPYTVALFDGPPELGAIVTISVASDMPITGHPPDAHPFRRQTMGYVGFYTDFYFDRRGRLLNLGVYE